MQPDKAQLQEPLIPVASKWPRHEQDEIDAVTRVLASGKVNGLVHGIETAAFAQEFAEFTGAQHGICMANGTVTLEIGLRALGIGAGDEVIVPARSFFATVSCVLAVGATPVFADIDAVSQNIDPASVEQLIGPKVRAVICVHLAGWPCDMARLTKLCEDHGLFLVEDCAQAHGATIDGRMAGSFGDIGSMSFCTDKIMSTGGEGGLLLVRNQDVFERAWSLKDHGKNRALLTDGKGKAGQFRFIHDSCGTNARMTEMQAAIGRIQLRKLPDWLRTRRRNAALLTDLLKDHPLVDAPAVPESVEHAWYKYYLLLKPHIASPDEVRSSIIADLIAMDIPCGSGSCPDMSQELGIASMAPRKDGALEGANAVGERTIMLPIDHTLESDAIQAMAEALWAIAG
ncbi:hypothetical protein CP97_06060 [Aurantiacibacter atlanticus]|uniref:Aminotransferase n=1 Tax=Aurantiacibacter atlanticus TaxID=1648404 RepID=A0A0H4VAS7_9SPHN|nr:DegT/DnrJ/EryC1/StrS family aminotransferase [Aurantiacibacter atlanticus]AKQ41682.1 hypothetical protein CP97_06060 [Aurantiacibacter atlanticus]MDF1833353.1 DegT/DnrJ/EryC1/StrS family aminotransferase [Alteraurantiacibacter sp. bin_em_oilr2.035]